MQVKHLLTLSTGQEQDLESVVEPAVFDPSLFGSKATSVVNDNWIKQFLTIPVKNAPGSQFFYSSGAVYMLSAIVQKTTGQTMLEYLQSRLFEPLGIEGADWETDLQGINTGGWGLSLKTEDLARFGLLYLQNGVWNGRRILPEQWVQAATSRQIRTVTYEAKPEDDGQNWCGYLFWHNRPGGFRMEGAFGQFCVVLPAQDAVIAFTAEYYDTQKGLDLVWKYLLPAMQSTPLPGNKATQKQLARKIASLSLLPQRGFSFSPVAQNVSGHVFQLQQNTLKVESITFLFKNDSCDFVLRDDRGEHRITCGINKWRKGKTD
jgi:CubicO group peptidase (beta-lactamase class C family)